MRTLREFLFGDHRPADAPEVSPASATLIQPNPNPLTRMAKLEVFDKHGTLIYLVDFDHIYGGDPVSGSVLKLYYGPTQVGVLEIA